MLQIILKGLSGNSVAIQIQSSASVKTLRKKVEQIEKVPPDQQRLIFAGQQLEDYHTLSQRKIVNDSTIHLTLRVRGGDFPSIQFNSLDQPIIGKFIDSAPDYRSVSKGLNLRGKCKNNSCQAFGKNVVIRKGYGTFNMNKEVKISKCPICKKNCEKVGNMILFMGSCTAKGLKKGDQDPIEIVSKHNDISNFLTYEDKDQTRIEWEFLQLQVKQLKQ